RRAVAFRALLPVIRPVSHCGSPFSATRRLQLYAFWAALSQRSACPGFDVRRRAALSSLRSLQYEGDGAPRGAHIVRPLRGWPSQRRKAAPCGAPLRLLSVRATLSIGSSSERMISRLPAGG